MNTELAEVLDADLQQLEFIQVLNKDVTFTNEKRDNRSIARFEATVLKKDTVIADQALKATIVKHLKNNLKYKYKEDIFEVYEIHVVAH